MRLRRSVLDGPCIRRRRRGRGFGYVGPDGAVVGDADRARIEALVIPPAWTDVWICPAPNGHIQATGVDDAGRTQYLYHPAWAERRSAAKFERVRALARLLPSVRRRLAEDLAASGLDRTRVVAGALTLMDAGMFRTGGEEYAVANGSHGVATLLREHATVHRGTTAFRFPAKSAQVADIALDDPQVARLVSSLKRTRGGSDRLLRYRDDTGVWHDVTGPDLNAALKDLAGEEFTVKDLRTWAATSLAGLTLAGLDPDVSAAEHRRQQREACRRVSEQLGNTPAVARRSYVDPDVFEAHDAHRTARPSLLQTLGPEDRRRLLAGDTDAIRDRAAVERSVLRLLERESRRRGRRAGTLSAAE